MRVRLSALLRPTPNLFGNSGDDSRAALPLTSIPLRGIMASMVQSLERAAPPRGAFRPQGQGPRGLAQVPRGERCAA